MAADLLVPSQPGANARAALDTLIVALAATKLAIEVADEAPRRATYGNPTPDQILENWQATAGLVNEMFDNLYSDVRHAVGLIKPMLTLD